jgi:hypothetical protein
MDQFAAIAILYLRHFLRVDRIALLARRLS